jgi:5-carboxymethyl-2-hydroxymuconate isomerase
MPHLVIEYSIGGHERFDMAELMRALHAAAASTGVVQAPDIKIRAISYDDYLVAGIRDGFCHVSVFLLEGRTPEQKLKLSESLRTSLSKMLPRTKSLSIDIRDMDSFAYKKRLLPDL